VIITIRLLFLILGGENGANTSLATHFRLVRRLIAYPVLSRTVQSALMLVCARLRYMEDSWRRTKLYLNIKHLEAMDLGKEVAVDLTAVDDQYQARTKCAQNR
jgi:hypothetical protein